MEIVRWPPSLAKSSMACRMAASICELKSSVVSAGVSIRGLRILPALFDFISLALSVNIPLLCFSGCISL